MSKGRSYDNAHEYATIADREARRKLGIGSFPGDAKYPWARMSNEAIAKKFYVKSTRKTDDSSDRHVEHSRATLSAVNGPVWSGLFKNTLDLFRKDFL